MRLLTLARDLQRRKARERQGLFVAEGIRTVEELLAAPLRPRGAVVSDALDTTPRGLALRERIAAAGIPLLEVTARDFATAADTDAPQGVLAGGEQPAVTLGDLPARGGARGGRLRVLPGGQDPGDVGRIPRSPAGSGAAGPPARARRPPACPPLW